MGQIFIRMCKQSQQKDPLSLRNNLIIIRLKSQPPLLRPTNLLRRKLSLLPLNNLPLMSTPQLRSINKQLRMTSLIQTNKPKRSLINTPTNLAQISISISIQQNTIPLE